jgi:hypothetical protein
LMQRRGWVLLFHGCIVEQLQKLQAAAAHVERNDPKDFERNASKPKRQYRSGCHSARLVRAGHGFCRRTTSVPAAQRQYSSPRLTKNCSSWRGDFKRKRLWRFAQCLCHGFAPNQKRPGLSRAFNSDIHVRGSMGFVTNRHPCQRSASYPGILDPDVESRSNACDFGCFSSRPDPTPL